MKYKIFIPEVLYILSVVFLYFFNSPALCLITFGIALAIDIYFSAFKRVEKKNFNTGIWILFILISKYLINQIAKILKISEAATKMRSSRLNKKIKEIYDKRGG